MEDRNSFPGQEYSFGEDLEGTSVVPFSYRSFSIEIPNTYSHINYLNSYHPQHRPSEFEQTYPSVWDYDYNTHVFPCVLCCDPSGSCLSQYPSVCYPEILIPQSSPYPFPSFTATSPTWTPGGAVECQPPSQVKPTCSSAPPEKNTLEQHTDSMRNFSEKSKKPCHCTKSLCLKLYCDCFANGEICNNCSCVNCCNNMEHETIRNKAIKTCLGRNPDAFNSKMHSSVQGAKGSYTRGCNCKSSGCLKNYCECYKAKIMCSSLCKCVSCSNYSRSKVKESAVQKSSHPDDNNTHHTTK